MFRYANNCTEALTASRVAFSELSDRYTELEKQANETVGLLEKEKQARIAAQEEVVKQTNKKRIWRGVAIAEGVGIVGTIVAVIFLL